MALDLKSRPNRVPWPPLIGAAALALAVLASRAAPLGLGLGPTARWLGWALIAAGLGLDLWAMATMARARVNILPHRAAGGLVASGPFAFTRNPIYLANTIALAGVGGAANSLWFVVAALVMAKLVEVLAIHREERHLALRFGREWADYAARVPRWLGLPSAARRRRGERTG
ncbi:MAG: isoprenylcysteine carboxylmethyltransferase family protein [Roseiarcus sp.]|jgi:protein-S-isoprenylcysteine O-methyltransferase Ste14